MSAKELKIMARFELTCYSEEGIEAIKRVLIESKSRINEESKDLKIDMKLVAPPTYEITTITTSKSAGTKILDKTLKLVTELTGLDKNFIFKVAVIPTAVGNDTT